jgi:hypothetical protein
LDVAIAAALGDLPEEAVGDVGGRSADIELRRVEDVVELGAELDVIPGLCTRLAS